MHDHEVREALRASLADGQLDRSERDAFRDWLQRSPPDGQKRALYQSMAFDLANDALERRVVPHYTALNWLERIVKLLTPPAQTPFQTQPGPASAPAAPEACFSPQDDCSGRIVALISQASRTIDVCVFTITDDRIAAGLLAAHRRRVQVRIVTDDEKRLDPGSDIERLAGAGVAVRFDRSEFHMHHKFAIFDGARLLTGSYNWTRSAALHNEENFIVTGDPRLLRAFTEAFAELWRQFASG